MQTDHGFFGTVYTHFYPPQPQNIRKDDYMIEECPLPPPNEFMNFPDVIQLAVGKWSLEEQKKYKKFLSENLEYFENKTIRKSHKVFLKMSKVINSRTAQQCRTHHQKMVKYYGSSFAVANSGRQIRFPAYEKAGKMRTTGAVEVEKRDNMSLRQPFRVTMSPENTIQILIDSSFIQEY